MQNSISSTFGFFDKFGQALGHSEMKKLMAGSDGGCIVCFTSGGTCGGEECWYVAGSTDPQSRCRCEQIYPGCDVIGNYTTCDSSCNYN